MNAIPPADLEAFAEAIRAERPDMEKLIDIAACATAAAMMFAGRCIELQRVVDAVNDPERVQGARILAEVCRDHNMSVRWLRRGSRDNLTVAARRDACVRLFKAGLTKSAVGRLVGIDHSSVGHALKRANGWVPPATRTPRTNLWTPREAAIAARVARAEISIDEALLKLPARTYHGLKEFIQRHKLKKAKP